MAEADTIPVTGAIAVWVKTPGLSPVKTRLAAAIGTAAAERFYLLSARAVQAVVEQASAESSLTPYWAVAEPDVAWPAFPSVRQGEGDLGRRLWRVYDALLPEHHHVIFIGADAPQITPELLHAAAATLRTPRSFVLGPAADGGFYLFGGNQPVPSRAWMEVPFSQSCTMQLLAGWLQRIGTLHHLPELFDIDTAEDLQRLGPLLARTTNLLPEQRRLCDWLSRRGHSAER